MTSGWLVCGSVNLNLRLDSPILMQIIFYRSNTCAFNEIHGVPWWKALQKPYTHNYSVVCTVQTILLHHENLSLVLRTTSVISSESSSQDHCEKGIRSYSKTADCISDVLNDKFVAGLFGSVPVHTSHDQWHMILMQCVRAWLLSLRIFYRAMH